MPRALNRCQEIERGILKKHRSALWGPFMSAITQYRLISPGDKIAVCVSGGKDSMLLAKLMQMLCRHSETAFEVCFLVMDPGYNAENRQKILSNAETLEIPVEIFSSDIFKIVETVSKSPCYLCARMRRGHLYAQARNRGCNKIALGHHFSDVVETVLMGMLYGAQIQTMMPKLHSQNFPGMELIRPMYRVHEDDIIAWRRHSSLDFLQCACRFTEQTATDTGASKRLEVKALLKQLKKDNPDVEKNIFKSVHMVNLETLIGYKSGGVETSFLDGYDKRTR
ncbi:MAG: tRNA 2-thiocytidine biosynthesis protein TtcA [Oscillospiraceae bacterium]|jgi:tRNA(Ile)-lysidine synthase TilS/MesJ|nr:tRNA 2-thiocytidine biosynthesis protein TtcA [Oscillospiraceae bacterium]